MTAGWSQKFDEPTIVLARGPMHALLLAARGGPMMLAHIGMMQAW